VIISEQTNLNRRFKMSKVTNLTAKEILKSMVNDTTIVTTRGTTGDASCEIVIDQDIIDEFCDCALNDVDDFTDKDVRGDFDDYLKACGCPLSDDAEYFYLTKNNQNILLWS
jgi:hypothetical protein